MKRILVVDDSPTMRRMIISSLRNLESLQFEQAGSGLEAIEKLAISRPDVIILDLNMPDMHGMEVLQFIRQHQAFSDIPVAVLTTKTDESSRSEALSGGAALFMTKPYEPVDFESRIRNLIKM